MRLSWRSEAGEKGAQIKRMEAKMSPRKHTTFNSLVGTRPKNPCNQMRSFYLEAPVALASANYWPTAITWVALKAIW